MSNEVQTTSANEPAPSQDNRTVQPVIPPVDIFEDESGITLLADLPGVSRERLGVRVDGDSLVIEGRAEVAGPAGIEMVYGEAHVPAYRREFTLSRELDASRIEAQLKDGVLRLAIPKADEARPLAHRRAGRLKARGGGAWRRLPTGRRQEPFPPDNPALRRSAPCRRNAAGGTQRR